MLTGGELTKATAAAEAAVPGATAQRAETDAEGAAYEVHMTKADGSVVTVKLDASFNGHVDDRRHGLTRPLALLLAPQPAQPSAPSLPRWAGSASRSRCRLPPPIQTDELVERLVAERIRRHVTERIDRHAAAARGTRSNGDTAARCRSSRSRSPGSSRPSR